MPQRLEPRLARELRAVAAGDDDLDVRGERDERLQVLARGLGGDAQDVGAREAERGARTVGVSVGGERRVDAAGDDRDALRRDLQ